MNLAIGALDIDTILKIAITIALAFGLKDLVASLLKAAARRVRDAVKGSPSKADDLAGEVLAKLLELGAEAALKGDLEKLRQIITTAAALPPPKPTSPPLPIDALRPGSALRR